MNDTQKQIIKLIEPYMDKTLSEGCIFKMKHHGSSIFTISLIERDIIYITKDFPNEWVDSIWIKKNNIEKILWHYDITAVLKYIHNFRPKTWELDTDSKTIISMILDWNEFVINFEYPKITLMMGEPKITLHKYVWFTPNKPLHLYSEQEEKDLLELLLKLR